MNKERLEKLARRLSRTAPEDFDMGRWCGSACCIAGHAATMADKYHGDVPITARRWLGLGPAAAVRLFLPDHFPAAFTATPKQAAKVIRHLIKTGKVEWERFV